LPLACEAQACESDAVVCTDEALVEAAAADVEADSAYWYADRYVVLLTNPLVCDAQAFAKLEAVVA
jgi:hypothetical protein